MNETIVVYEDNPVFYEQIHSDFFIYSLIVISIFFIVLIFKPSKKNAED